MTIGTSAPPDFFKFLALPVSSLKNHRIYSFCGLLAESREHHLSSRVLTAGVAEHLLPLVRKYNILSCSLILSPALKFVFALADHIAPHICYLS
jgi:hypothetical protein